jgi:dihydrofolate reductase
MRKTVASILTTLDGVVESPEKWQLRYFDDELGKLIDAAAANADTMLLGRRTYEEFAAFWPGQNGNEPMADYMNETPKHVVSTTLTELEWRNSSLVAGNVAVAVDALKRQAGGNIQIYGSPTLVRSLLRDGLLDELDLLVHPIVVGGGKRLFENANYGTALRLVESHPLGSGVLALRYVQSAREGG